MTKKTWLERKSEGGSVEELFDFWAQDHDLTVLHLSQHRRESKDKTIRHAPDFLVKEWGALVQVKSANRCIELPDTVIGEKDSIDVARDFSRDGWKVLVVWYFQNGVHEGSFRGNYAESLDTFALISNESRRKGSGTPAYRIKLESLCDLEDFFILFQSQ